MQQKLGRKKENEDFQAWPLTGWETGPRHSCSFQGRSLKTSGSGFPEEGRLPSRLLGNGFFGGFPSLRFLLLEVSLLKAASRTYPAAASSKNSFQLWPQQTRIHFGGYSRSLRPEFVLVIYRCACLARDSSWLVCGSPPRVFEL